MGDSYTPITEFPNQSSDHKNIFFMVLVSVWIKIFWSVLWLWLWLGLVCSGGDALLLSPLLDYV